MTDKPADDISNEAVFARNRETRRKVTSLFSREEIRALTARSNLMGIYALVHTWAVIGACFLALAWALAQSWPLAVPVCLLAVAVLGGRQLALAILTHEATHKTLFRSRWANDWLTDWLCARPIGLDLKKYRAHHFIHHTRTGTDEDSDISLIAGLPTTRVSLARKFLRDLAGITGVKFLLGRVMMDAELLKWTVATDITPLPRQGWRFHARRWLVNAGPMVIMQAVLFAVLWLAGYPQLYLAWVLAYLVPYPLFIRIRALAEHAGTERCADMFRNTRTTRAGFLARAFVAPFRVNYHLEHHAMASVPWFRLKTMHRLLRERDAVSPPTGYWRVMAIVSSAPAAP
ncbi:MAG: fatty acid desaturase family protein [Alcanivoracaceae bacterium]